MLKNAKRIQKSLHLATSENLNKSSLLPNTYNAKLDNIESYFYLYFIGKHSFYPIFLYNLKLHCISLVLPFLSNIESQVSEVEGMWPPNAGHMI